MLVLLHLTAFWFADGPAWSSIEHRSRENRSQNSVLSDDFECLCGGILKMLMSYPQVVLIPNGGVGGSTAIRVTYRGDQRGSSHLSRSFRLPVKRLEYSLNYDVKFDKHFQFVKGGKLHGFAPDRPAGGGRPVGVTSWSARVMWRGNGKVGTYTYHQRQRGRYGNRGRVVRSFAFKKGTYHAVSLHVKLNRPAALSNGFVRLYVDGRLIEQEEGVRFRSVDGRASLISRFLFTTFHGGHDATWAPKTRDGHYANVDAYFDNIAVYAGERIRQQPGF